MIEDLRKHLTDVAIAKIVILPNGCWEWRGATNRKNGYSLISTKKGKTKIGHRLIWEIVNHQPFPAKLVGDHTCHDPKICKLGDACPHRRCLNPEHVDPVTQAVNLQRGEQQNRSHCPKGHEYTPENTYKHKNRNSKTCRRCTIDGKS
jgi:hypothetical protein